MTVQILVSTMNQTDYHLVEKMNLFADAIVINQCDKTSKDTFTYNGHKIEWYNFDERGIGLSRNTALMRATADVCLFADDDMVYYDDSLAAVERAFVENSDSDVIVFNVDKPNAYKCKNVERLHIWNALKYGTIRLAVKREQIIKQRISFSLLFGGGAKYSCGEDTLFIHDCLKVGLRMVATPEVLGQNTQGPSTWFSGYNRKFFFDKGVLYKSLSSGYAFLYCFYYVVKHRKMLMRNGVDVKKALSWMIEGVHSA